jgi:cytoskeletal protein RodZ
LVNNFLEVEKLKKGLIFLFVVAFIFSFTLSVSAEEGHDKNVKQATESEQSEEADTHTQEAESHSEEADSHSEKADSHTEAAEAHEKEAEAHPEEADVHSEAAEAHGDAANAHSDAADAHGEEEGSHDEKAGTHTVKEETHGDEEAVDHHGPVVETPPNYKVLGSYGAVNLSFILIGVWNKWFRRKGN